MLKKTTLIVLLLLVISVYDGWAQNVGINTSGAAPDASAMLDIVSTGKGLLIPRVALTATNAAGPITNPQNTLIVYNTATAGAAPNNVLPGLYFNIGTTVSPNWVPLLGNNVAANGGWSLLGNSGTTAGTNYIGTNDVQDFVIKTSAVINTPTERMRVTSTGNVGINVNPTSLLHIVQPVSTTGSPTAMTLAGGAHTTLTLSVEATDVNFNLARTVQFATGALATQRAMRIQAPTYAFVGASTITDATTLSISGAPVKGTNATITNSSALRISPGAVSTVTNAYGLYVDAPTGATKNYAATFKTGNVGIGTATPNAQLEISAVSGTNAAYLSGTSTSLILCNGVANNSNQRGGIGVASVVNNYGVGNQVNDLSIFAQVGNMNFSTTTSAGGNPNIRMSILNTGNVGIGSTGPIKPLDIVNDVSGGNDWSQLRLNNNEDYIAGVSLTNSASPNEWVVYRYGSDQGDRFNIGLNNVSEPFTIQTDGNVGINTTSPQAALEVDANYNGGGIGMLHLYSSGAESGISLIKEANGEQSYSFKCGDAGNGGSYFGLHDETNGGACRLSVDVNGNVGINNNSPGYLLDVSGNFACDNQQIYSDGNGNLVANAYNLSDMRYKKEIQPISNSLDNLMKLRGVTYLWRQEDFPKKHFSSQREMGVIAQEVEQLFPDLVNTDKNGFKSVNYAKFAPLLIEAIKEQQKMIDELKSENANLKSENKSIVKDIVSIKTMLEESAKK